MLLAGLVQVGGVLHPEVGIDADLERLLAEDPGLYLDAGPPPSVVQGCEPKAASSFIPATTSTNTEPVRRNDMR